MELQDMPIADAREADAQESAAVLSLEDQEMDRIAFELWQRGSLPGVAETTQAELEEVACHASCL
jgi:hypothetical protein